LGRESWQQAADPVVWHSDPVSTTPVNAGPDLLVETLEVASTLVGTPLTPVGPPFPGSHRTLVVRVADDQGGTVVVKRYLGDDGVEAYAREASALEALAAFGQTPALVAECAEPRLVVMEDLGGGRHLAEVLLGSDADLATATLSGWAAAVAGLHRSGREVRDAFASGVLARSPGPVELDPLPGHLATAASEWARLATHLDVALPAGTFDVLTSVPSRFRVEASSLSAADMCPDNNLVRDLGDSGIALLDFEFALWRPIAWDAAYLRVPWPTCWCAWSLEAAAADLALQRWRGTVAQTWPEVLGTDFDHDLELATEAWAWLAGSWCLAGLVDAGPARANPVKPTPRMPDRVLRFLRTASTGNALPELADAAAQLARAVETRYAAADVPFAPAFTVGAPR
jgi:hypothetical protein